MFSGYLERIREIAIARPDIIGTGYNLELTYQVVQYGVDEYGQTTVDTKVDRRIKARVVSKEDPYAEKGAQLDRSRHYIEGNLLEWVEGYKELPSSIDGIYLDSDGWKACKFGKIEIIRPNYLEKMEVSRSLGQKIIGYLTFNDAS